MSRSKHKIVLLVGRSGSGKTAIANYLHDTYGWNAVSSYTTRLPRYEGEAGHIFISDEDFDQLCDFVAYTEFDGHRYCATADQVDQSDLYVVDLVGVKTMQQLYHGDSIILPVYLDVSRSQCFKRMLKRGDGFRAAWQRKKNDDQMFDGAKEYLMNHFGSCLSVKNSGSLEDAGDMIYRWATI